MQRIGHGARIGERAVGWMVLAGVLALSGSGVFAAADEPKSVPQDATHPAASMQTVMEDIRALTEQIQALRARIEEIQENEKRAKEEALNLRRELCLTKAKMDGTPGGLCDQDPPASPKSQITQTVESTTASRGTANEVAEDRVGKLEEDQQLTEAKLNDQYQTKIESGSKYRVRLSGIVLLNVYGNRGGVDNQDFPGVARELAPLDSHGAFGGTLRQSQVSLQAFGPEIGGAHTSADLKFDFAGGFPDKPDGVAEGLVRLRTGTIRMDWGNTSLIAGQDRLFFVPLSPSSIATLAEPEFSYAGNLWAWTPQVRVEHRQVVTEGSSLMFQAGILDSLSGDAPTENYRQASVGEKSGQPAYATRVAWTGHLLGQEMTAGTGGYYGRQYWGFNRHVDGWAGTTDLQLPMGRYFQLSGAFYRGRGVGGLRGGIGQGALWNGDLADPATAVKGFDAMGGWAQLKYKVRPKLEFNGGFGQDNPFAHELRGFPTHSVEYDQPLGRNRSAMVNFIWQPRSDFLVSTEYRRLRTTEVGGDSYFASHINFALGYIF